MGMFDYVEFEMPCPNCGSVVDNFQSKDGSCSLGTLKIADVNNFYDFCNKCGAWIEFHRLNRPNISAKDYKGQWRKDNGKKWYNVPQKTLETLIKF